MYVAVSRNGHTIQVPAGTFCLYASLWRSIAAERSFSHKRTAVAEYFSASLPERKTLPYFHLQLFNPFLFPSTGMAATTAYAARVSAGEYPHAHGYGSVSPPLTPLSATLVNTSHHNNERPSVKLKIPCGQSNIVNSVVIDTAGQSLYSVSSNSKRTTLISCRNNAEVATIEWDRSSPRLVYRRKKMRCKEWLPLAGPETEYAYTRPLSPCI